MPGSGGWKYRMTHVACIMTSASSNHVTLVQSCPRVTSRVVSSPLHDTNITTLCLQHRRCTSLPQTPCCRLFRDAALFLASRPFSAVAEIGGGGHALCSTSHMETGNTTSVTNGSHQTLAVACCYRSSCEVTAATGWTLSPPSDS